MADIKISALPAASVVNDADIAVINQGGTTKSAAKSLIVAGLATTTQISGLATTSQLSGFATTGQISGFTNTAQVSAIASAQIAAITPASIGALSTSAASGFATTQQIVGIAVTSQLSGFATTDQISGFTNSAQVQSLASAQIAAITPASLGAVATSDIIGINKGGTGATDAPSALAALGGITSAQVPAFDSAQLSAYVLKAGATMDGRLIMAATTAQAKANIGGALSGVAAPSSSIAGDVWVSNQSKLTFSPSSGVAVGVAGLTQTNTFNQTQTIGVGGTVNALTVSNNGTGRAATFTAASSSAAVSILQTGAGEAFRVEDETSPDTTLFVISASGRVGIGVAPDAVTALAVDSGGIKFADGSIATTALAGGGLNSAQVQSLTSAQIAAITPASLGAVATSDIIGISKGGTGATDAPSALSALGGITSASLSGFATTAQVGGLTSAQVESIASAQISALGTGLGAGQKWSATTTYKAGDVVTVENSSQAYVSLTDGNTGAPPYLGSPWQRIDANALSLQGYGISNSTPQNSQVLKFQSGYDIWVPGEISITSAQLPSNTLEAIGGAPLAEPYFTGYGPQGPTKSFGTNNNYLATTAFVRQNSSLFKFSPVGQAQEISVGTKYIIASDLSFIPKQAVLLYADSSNYMTGSVVSYNGGLLEINVTNAVGSGYYDITITVSPEVTGGGGGGLDSAQVNALVTEQIAALGTGLGAGQVWNSSKTYSAGDIVTLSGTLNTYSSLENNNTGNSPAVGFPWALISANAASIQGKYIAMGNPSLGDVLIYNGSQWASTAPASGLNSAQVEALTSTQIAAITPASIGAFATSAIIAISNGGTGSTDAVSALAALGAAPLESPAFTGTPTAPTAAAHTSTTQVATTAFVMSNSGDRYLTTSTSLNSVGNGTKTFTVEPGLSYTPTQDCTIVFDASNHMHGLVSSYSGTTLVVDVTQHTGSGSYSVWTINVGGLTTAAGALLSANNLSDVASPSTSLTNLGGVSTARTISAGTGLSGGGDLTADRTLSLANTTVTAGSYGSSSQIAALTVDAQGRLTAASNIAMPSVDVQVFNTVGTATWTKPAGAKLVVFDVVAGGGGGGSGGKAAAGTAIYGGGGGGGGGYTSISYAASDLADASYTIAVAAGGTGGIFGGTAASAGGTSTATGTTQGIIARASGGSAGGTGTTTAGSAGSFGTYGTNAGGASNITTTAGGGSGGTRGPASGGAGGGCSTSAPFAGGLGGSNVPFGLAGAAGGALSTTANGGSGGNGNLKTGFASALFTGSGGGGGGATTFATGSGGNGGNGANFGCAGGGGGATQGSGNGGNGGNGAGGIVVITTYF